MGENLLLYLLVHCSIITNEYIAYENLLVEKDFQQYPSFQAMLLEQRLSAVIVISTLRTTVHFWGSHRKYSLIHL